MYVERIFYGSNATDTFWETKLYLLYILISIWFGSISYLQREDNIWDLNYFLISFALITRMILKEKNKLDISTRNFLLALNIKIFALKISPPHHKQFSLSLT